MKRFFCSLLRFAAFFLMFFIPLCLGIHSYLHAEFDPLVSEAQKAKILIMGASFVDLSINEEHIEGSLKLASNAESYDFSFAKIKAISNMDANLEVLVLGVFYNPIPPSKLSRYHYHHSFLYYPFLKANIAEHKPIFEHETYLEVLLNHEFGIPTRGFVSEIKDAIYCQRKLSRYPPISKQIAIFPQPWEESVKMLFYNQDTEELNDISPFFVTELHKIKDLCQQKGYKLILYNAPLHKDFHDHIPDIYKLAIDSVVNSIVDNRNIYYLNYSQYPLPDSCFRDLFHTNIYGANIITPVLRDSLISLGIIQP
jgi:hypothetical protein